MLVQWCDWYNEIDVLIIVVWIFFPKIWVLGSSLLRKAMPELDKKILEVSLRFRNSDEGWLFWVAYGSRIGFDVRKRCTNVRRMDGTVTNCKHNIWQSVLDLKRELIEKLGWLFHWIEVQEIMKSLMLWLNTTTHFTYQRPSTWWSHNRKFQNSKLSK